MARKAFLLRIDENILNAVQRWADDDLRSLNGQIEFILRRILLENGRLKKTPEPPPEEANPEDKPA